MAIQETPVIERTISRLKQPASPPSSLPQFNYDAFMAYLQGIAGGNRSLTTSKSIAADVMKFFSQSARTSTMTDKDLLLSKKALEAYFVYLKTTKEFKPSTISEKLRRMKMAIRFVIHESDNDPVGDALYLRGQKLLDALTGWGKSLSKPIAVQRQEHSAKVVEEMPLIEEPNNFLDNNDVIQKLECAIKRLETRMKTEDVILLTAYCAAKIVYTNGQRSGVIENVTVQEFMNRTENEDGMTIITCKHHKTGPQGAARLVLTKTTDGLFNKYFNLIRQRIKPHEGINHLFFLTANGRKYTQVYRKIQEAININNIKGIELPAPSQYRRVVRTHASQSLNDQGLRNLAKHMCHSSETARQYYEYSNYSDAVTAHHTITEMAQRRTWSQEETDALLKAWPLQNPRPELKTCTLIKEKCNFEERSPKNIQDKWRQLQKKQQHK